MPPRSQSIDHDDHAKLKTAQGIEINDKIKNTDI